MEIDGQTTSVLFLDTEGFESIGKSTVYDDRSAASVVHTSAQLLDAVLESLELENEEACFSPNSWVISSQNLRAGSDYELCSHLQPA